MSPFSPSPRSPNLRQPARSIPRHRQVRIGSQIVIDAQEALVRGQLAPLQHGVDGRALVDLVEHGAEDEIRAHDVDGAVELLLVEGAVPAGELVEDAVGVRVAVGPAGPHHHAAIDAEVPQRGRVLGRLAPVPEPVVPVQVVRADRPRLQHIRQSVHGPVPAGLVLDELGVPSLLHAEDDVVPRALQGVDEGGAVVDAHGRHDADAPYLDDGLPVVVHVHGRVGDVREAGQVR